MRTQYLTRAMRRNVGLSSLSPHQSATYGAAYDSLSSSLSSQQLSSLQSQLATFQTALRTFANKHRNKILSDPIFRTHFADMCNQLGVDPLGSGGRKGLWEDFLGVGDWTFTLAVQVVDVCLRNRDKNGGLMAMDELIRGVTRLRSGNNSSPSVIGSNSNSVGASISGFKTGKSSKNDTSVTVADIARAISALEPLGCGYSIITVGHQKMVRSVAAEFDTDSLTIVEAISDSKQGYATVTSLRVWTSVKRGSNVDSNSTPVATFGAAPGWTITRAENALHKALMADGLVWLDDQGEGELQYWMPSIFDFQEES